MSPEVKKTGRQKLLQHKNASTLSQVISVLKMELKIEFCFLNYHLMSLNAKKILEHIF
jgi:hypothetical protein